MLGVPSTIYTPWRGTLHLRYLQRYAPLGWIVGCPELPCCTCMTWKDELPLKFPSMKSLWFLVSCLSSWSSKEEINMAVFKETPIFVLKSSFSNTKILKETKLILRVSKLYKFIDIFHFKSNFIGLCSEWFQITPKISTLYMCVIFGAQVWYEHATASSPMQA